MNWKQYISQLKSKETETGYKFNSPVPHFLLQDLQVEFGLEELPRELVELYKETNGIDETLNGEKIGELIWTIQRVIETNREYRNHEDFKQFICLSTNYFSFPTLVMETSLVL